MPPLPAPVNKAESCPAAARPGEINARSHARSRIKSIQIKKIGVSTELNALANQECKLIGGLGAMPSRHPAAEESRTDGEGAARPLSLVAGGTIVKRLEGVEIKERVYSYSIVDGPLPVSDQVATIKVGEKGDGTAAAIERSSGFRPSRASESEAQESVQAIYDAGLKNLKKNFRGRL